MKLRPVGAATAGRTPVLASISLGCSTTLWRGNMSSGKARCRRPAISMLAFPFVPASNDSVSYKKFPNGFTQ